MADVIEEKLYIVIWFIPPKNKPPSLLIYLVRSTPKAKTMSRPGHVRVFSVLVMCVGKKPWSGPIFRPSKQCYHLSINKI